MNSLLTATYKCLSLKREKGVYLHTLSFFNFFIKGCQLGILN